MALVSGSGAAVFESYCVYGDDYVVIEGGLMMSAFFNAFFGTLGKFASGIAILALIIYVLSN